MANTKYVVSFVDAQTIQIRLELGEIIDGAQTTEFPDGAIIYSDGNVNDANNQPLGRSWGDNKYLLPYDTYNASPIDDLFDTQVIDGVAQAPADTLSRWQVQIDGQTVTVEAVSRKTSILDTALVGHYNDNEFKTLENVYLRLAEPIDEGARITIGFDDADFQTQTVVYNPETVVSEAIHVNLKGFDPDDDYKVAYLSSWNGWDVDASLPGGGSGVAQEYAPGTGWQIIDEATGRVVMSGEIELTTSKDDPQNFTQNFQKTDTFSIDFSALTAAGTYHVVVDGVGRSNSFDVAETHWGDTFELAMSGFYHQRSGIALEQPYTDWERPSSLDPDEGLVVTQSSLKITDTTESYKSGSGLVSHVVGLDPEYDTGVVVENAQGGWHDAGDWDRRTQHLEASRKMIENFENAPEYYETVTLNIPESGNDIPDILDEAIYGATVFRNLQKADGGVPGGIESTDNPRTGDGSWHNSSEVYVYAPDVWTSWEYAATAAKISHALKDYNAAESAAWQESAIRAMNWAESQNEPTDETTILSRNTAAAELYRLTGNETWHNIFKETTVYDKPSWQVQWNEHQFEGAYVYIRTTQPGVDTAIQTSAREDILREAEYISSNFGDRGAYGSTVNAFGKTGWGSNEVSMDEATDLYIRAHVLSGDDKWLAEIQSEAQYLMGANPLNMSYLTGLEGRNVENFLNVDAEALGVDGPDGITLYGEHNINDYGYTWFHGQIEDDVWPNFYQTPVGESYQGYTLYVPITEYTVQQGMTDTAYVTGYLAAQSEEDDAIYIATGQSRMSGGATDDYLRGRTGNDRLSGLAGNDKLDGGAGNDVLNGGAGDDSLSGADGNDKLLGAAGNDRMNGGAGNDSLAGQDGNDFLIGGTGNDTITGGAGTDSLLGGDGRDILSGQDGNDTLQGGGDNDRVNGGNGNDSVGGGIGNDSLYGGLGNDSLYGDEGIDLLRGDGGDDVLYGGGGADSLSGGIGNDLLDGGAGNDVLLGGTGFDRFIFGLGYGDDRISGFQRSVDKIEIDDALWSGTLTVLQMLEEYGTLSSNNKTLTLDFDSGDSLVIQNALAFNYDLFAHDILIV